MSLYSPIHDYLFTGENHQQNVCTSRVDICQVCSKLCCKDCLLVLVSIDNDTLTANYQCKQCIFDFEHNEIMKIIDTALCNLFDINVTRLIAQYSVGFIVKCCGFGSDDDVSRCKNEINFFSLFQYQHCVDCDNNKIYYSQPDIGNICYTEAPYVWNENGTRIRIFCFECSVRLKQCIIPNCDNKDLSDICCDHPNCHICSNIIYHLYEASKCSFCNKYYHTNCCKLFYNEALLCRECDSDNQFKLISDVVMQTIGHMMTDDIIAHIVEFSFGFMKFYKDLLSLTAAQSQWMRTDNNELLLQQEIMSYGKIKYIECGSCLELILTNKHDRNTVIDIMEKYFCSCLHYNVSLYLTTKQMEMFQLNPDKLVDVEKELKKFGVDNIKIDFNPYALRLVLEAKITDLNAILYSLETKMNFGTLLTMNELEAIANKIKHICDELELIDDNPHALNLDFLHITLMHSLENGLLFIKHRKRGDCTKQYIVVKRDRLYWKRKTYHRNTRPRSVNLRKIIQIVIGKHSKALQHRKLDDIAPDCCFSIVTKKATLDFSTIGGNPVDVIKCVEYIKGFKKHFDQRNTQRIYNQNDINIIKTNIKHKKYLYPVPGKNAEADSDGILLVFLTKRQMNILCTLPIKQYIDILKNDLSQFIVNIKNINIEIELNKTAQTLLFNCKIYHSAKLKNVITYTLEQRLGVLLTSKEINDALLLINYTRKNQELNETNFMNNMEEYLNHKHLFILSINIDTKKPDTKQYFFHIKQNRLYWNKSVHTFDGNIKKKSIHLNDISNICTDTCNGFYIVTTKQILQLSYNDTSDTDLVTFTAYLSLLYKHAQTVTSDLQFI